MKVLERDDRLAHLSAGEMGGASCPQDRFFAPDSLWRTPVTDYTPYQHPTIPEANSRNWAVSLCEQMDLNPDTGLPNPGGSGNRAWLGGNIPLYVVPAGYPRRPFALDDQGLVTVGGAPLDALLRAGVPAPWDAALGASGVNDKWMGFYQPSTDTLWEGYGASQSTVDGPFDRFRWGGVIIGVSKHQGTYRDRWNIRGDQIEHQRWSANATSISNVAGLVSIEEVAAGVIDHAIPMSVGHAQHTPIPYVWPATRADGDLYDSPGVIVEGARVVFPPDADFSRVRPDFMPIARAIQKFGVIPTDKTGGGVSLHLRDYAISDGRSWSDVLTLYQTKADAPYFYMSSLPWHEAIVVAV